MKERKPGNEKNANGSVGNVSKAITCPDLPGKLYSAQKP